jgi:hypothetical protein
MLRASHGGKTGKRSRELRVYVKLYEMRGEFAKHSTTSASFTVYGIGCKDLERLIREAIGQAAIRVPSL